MACFHMMLTFLCFFALHAHAREDTTQVSCEEEANAEDEESLLQVGVQKTDKLTAIVKDLPVQPEVVQADVGGNSSWLSVFVRSMPAQLEYELAPTTVPVVNKVVLVLIEGLGLGFCGIDRCYMGQTCLGIFKALTFGGLGIWFSIDWFMVMFNCLMSTTEMHMLGFSASFVHDTIKPASWIAVAFLMLYLIGKCCHSKVWVAATIAEPKPTREAESESISRVLTS